MKKFCLLLLASSSVLAASAQSNVKNVKLIGIINGFGIKCAMLEVEDTNRHRVEQMVLREGQMQKPVEVVMIDSDKGTVAAKVGGEARSLTFEKKDTDAAGSKAAGPAIRFDNLERQSAIYFYALLKDRTILQHPALGAKLFSLTANPKDKSEAVVAFEKMFEEKGVVSIPDGDKFVMLVPAALTNSVIPHCPATAGGEQLTASGSVNFVNVPLNALIEVYSEYLGGKVTNMSEVPYIQGVYLYQQTPLTKEQISYALETLITWNGLRLVPGDGKTLKVERISTQANHGATNAR